MKTDRQPTVSVIIPTFNGAQYIVEAIQSVLNQTFQNFEIIVIDDGSTDITASLLESWANQGLISYTQQSHQGPAAARNQGIVQSRGKFLKFLDHDDYLYPEQLERQVQHLLQRSRFVISATDYELEFESKNRVPIELSLYTDQLAQFIKGNPCPIHSLLVPRKLIEDAGGFDENLQSHVDSELWLRVLINGGTVEKTPYTGCCYRIHKGSVSADRNRMFQEYCKFSEKLNMALVPQFHQLSDETLRQLFFKNMSTLHKCFYQDIQPALQIPTTLLSTRLLYEMKANKFERFWLSFHGMERIAWNFYRQACRRDRGYSEKLLNEAWRDERFYAKNKNRESVIPNGHIKNILYVNSSAVLYGAETRLLDIIKYLDRDRFRPFALIPSEGPLVEQLRDLGVAPLQLDYRFKVQMKYPGSGLTIFWKTNQELVNLARKHKIDLIHMNLHTFIGNFWLAFLILRKPVIVHMRSHLWIEIFEKFVICRTTKAICISKAAESSFLKKRRSTFLMRHSRNHTTIIYDGIDVKFFHPNGVDGKIRRELSIGRHDFFVGLIGAIDKVKGQDILVEAAYLVCQKHPSTKFVLVGDLYLNTRRNNEYRTKLIKRIKELELEGNVLLTGFRKDIHHFMNEIDVLVQPSERETLGTSMVEAMACGKPVIGSNVDGIPEVIGEDEAGIVLPERTPQALAQAIIFFIENPQEARRRGLQGRERALKKFNVFENIKRLEDIYQQTLGGWQ
jgi:glycosyltransferase involved in cell wall biosynthesis/GT2 family glycosyltransferase